MLRISLQRLAQHDKGRCNISALQRFLGRRSLGEGGKLLARDHAEAHTIARTQKCRRIFCRIEKLKRGAADQIPAAWRTHRINPCLRAANSNRAGRNIFSRRVPARHRQFLWQSCQERKAGNEPDAGHPILCSAVDIYNSLCGDLRVARNAIKIRSKLGIVTNWNFHDANIARSNVSRVGGGQRSRLQLRELAPPANRTLCLVFRLTLRS